MLYKWVLLLLPILVHATPAPVYHAGNTTITAPWARATSMRNAAVFMTLSNPEGDALTEATTPICDKVELHAHLREGDIMRMRPVDEITVSTETRLKPGGLHIMLLGLEKPLVPGQTFQLTLTFQKGGSIVISVPVSVREPYSKVGCCPG